MLNLNLKNKCYLSILTILLLNGCGGGDSGTPSIVNGEISTFSDLTSEEQETLSNLNTNQQALLDAINKERAESKTCGERGTFPAVPALTWNPDLYAAALEHVTDLAYSNTFSHDGSGTEYDITGNGTPSKFYERIVSNGYSNYFSVGENIAGGQRDLDSVMKAWMASPGHCVNIMKSTYTEVGVAILIKEDSTYQVYWGQNFGSKRG
ncbi:MAG: Transporter [uncultured Sulfurovum sp.]|uniref:Transporter n=1 Tax=uncultured Sulfurovum sp. TaxID=269237 RepID=A0A6S6SNY9_9BACT|nr:MAG: Transporter [uncultured Sulfurovum sp.]